MKALMIVVAVLALTALGTVLAVELGTDAPAAQQADPIPVDGYDWDKACRSEPWYGFCVNTAETCKDSYDGKVVGGDDLCKSEILPVCCKK